MNQKQKKHLARQLYISDDMTQKEIATYIATSEKTISKWKKDEKWDDIKSATSLGSDEIIRNCYLDILLLQKLAKEEDRPMTNGETDKMLKTAHTIKDLSGNKTSLPQIITAFKEYDKWLVQIDAHLAQRNSEFQKKFIQMKASNE